MLPLETFEWLHRTRMSFNHFLLAQINERLHWFMGNYAAQRLLDADSQVARALAGFFHPWLHPLGQAHLARPRRRRSPACRGCPGSAATRR